MKKGQEPTGAYVGVSKDDRVARWAHFFRIELSWCHIFWLFTFPGEEPAVWEANWKGVRRAEWNKAHQADGYAFFADDRMTPHSVSALWWWCQGSVGKLYNFGLLVWLALRLAWDAWTRLRGLVTGRGGVSAVCSSFVSESARAVFGEPYADRFDPTPDEITLSPHLRPARNSD